MAASGPGLRGTPAATRMRWTAWAPVCVAPDHATAPPLGAGAKPVKDQPSKSQTAPGQKKKFVYFSRNVIWAEL